jgi:hypothetical protein
MTALMKANTGTIIPLAEGTCNARTAHARACATSTHHASRGGHQGRPYGGHQGRPYALMALVRGVGASLVLAHHAINGDVAQAHAPTPPTA